MESLRRVYVLDTLLSKFVLWVFNLADHTCWFLLNFLLNRMSVNTGSRFSTSCSSFAKLQMFICISWSFAFEFSNLSYVFYLMITHFVFFLLSAVLESSYQSRGRYGPGRLSHLSTPTLPRQQKLNSSFQPQPQGFGQVCLFGFHNSAVCSDVCSFNRILCRIVMLLTRFDRDVIDSAVNLTTCFTVSTCAVYNGVAWSRAARSSGPSR